MRLGQSSALNMDLFTLIGMLLSVFGAAYSANSALRGHFEEEIRDGAREASSKVRFIKDNDIAPTVAFFLGGSVKESAGQVPPTSGKVMPGTWGSTQQL